MMDSDLIQKLHGFGRNSSSCAKPQAIYYVISLPMRCSKALFIETYELFVDLQLLKSVICCVEYHNWVNSQDLNRYTKLLKVVHSKSTILLNRNRSTVVEVINQ